MKTQPGTSDSSYPEPLGFLRKRQNLVVIREPFRPYCVCRKLETILAAPSS